MINKLRSSELFYEIDITLAQFIIRQGGNELAALSAASVSRELRQGHSCFDISDNSDQRQDYQKHSDLFILPKSCEWQKKLLCQNSVVGRKNSYLPLIIENNRIYLQRYWKYEFELSKKLTEMAKKPDDFFHNIKLNVPTENLPKNLTNDEKRDWQHGAVCATMASFLTIVTGGPGTGKTTVMSRILTEFYKHDPTLRVALAAPTGKAVMRMNESLGFASQYADDNDIKKFLGSLKVQTIHRLLGWVSDSCYFKYRQNNPISYDLVIVDEVSMVDLSLMYMLVSALPKSCRLLLLGDRDQLTSVSAGTVLTDICEAFGVNCFSQTFLNWCNNPIPEPDRHIISKGNSITPNIVIELKRSRRFSTTGGIGHISSLIKSGAPATTIVTAFEKEDNCKLFALKKADQFLDSDKIVQMFRPLIEANSPDAALKIMGQFVILSARRKGLFGAEIINKNVGKILVKNGLISTADSLYRCQPIMIVENDYGTGLYNGDTGVIFDQNGDGIFKAWFRNTDGKLRSYLPALLPAYETAFAITIHKSQGSEYDSLFIILPNTDSSLLTRELIYTSITRARESVMIYSQREILLAALGRHVQRASGLADLMR